MIQEIFVTFYSRFCFLASNTNNDTKSNKFKCCGNLKKFVLHTKKKKRTKRKSVINLNVTFFCHKFFFCFLFEVFTFYLKIPLMIKRCVKLPKYNKHQAVAFCRFAMEIRLNGKNLCKVF